MTPITIVASALVSFAYVFLKSSQQLNVVHNSYAWIPVVSIAMGVSEAAILLFIVKAGSVLIGITNGIGGACGAMLAMQLHKRFVRKVL